VEKLKQYDKKVFVVGGRAFTSVILQRNCHEFIAYENLAGVRKQPAKGERPMPAVAASPIAQAFPIVRRALKILADREVTPQTGLLKSTLLQLDSTFSERNYGASSFLDFVEKLAHTGVVALKHSGRSVMVELNSGFEDADAAAPKPHTPTDEATGDTSAALAAAMGISRPPQDQRSPQEQRPPHEQRPPIEATESAGDGVRVVGQILRNATGARWPMYLRNVKQILRSADAAFDERRYGFVGLMDLLKACQREGLVRLERDRRGGLRVFQGAAIQRTAASEPILDVEQTDADAQPRHIVAAPDMDAESEVGPIPIDTTAELLGRAKARRPRSRLGARAPEAPAAPAATTASGRAARKPSARKAAAPRRTARSKKNGPAAANDTTE
jgi:hypothetical protein